MQIELIRHLSEDGAKEMLSDIIERLDELDQEDFFGTEGWRQFFGMED